MNEMFTTNICTVLSNVRLVFFHYKLKYIGNGILFINFLGIQGVAHK